MPDEEPDLTPEQDQEVRRLLSEARHDEPMPEDVAIRLERVLAQLAAGDPAHDPATVVELASRRRRRAASLLVAAAAVVAVGVGLGQVIGAGAGDSGSNSATSDSVRQADGNAPEDADDKSSAEGQPPDGLTPSLEADAAPVTIRSAHFATDVRRAQRHAIAERNTSASQFSAAQPWFECAPADFGSGVLVPVFYDDEPAVLALRESTGETQVVDLLQCGSGEILRSITLPIS